MIVPFWSWNLSHAKFQLVWAINTAISRGPSLKCVAGTPSLLGLTKKGFLTKKYLTQEKIFYSGKKYFTHRIVEHYRVGSLDVAGDLVGLGEDHLGHVVGVGTHLELARLEINNSGKNV